MKLNMGIADRIIRFLIAVLVTVLYLTGVITGVIGATLMVVAFVFVLTSFTGFCPIYSIFRIKRWEREAK